MRRTLLGGVLVLASLCLGATGPKRGRLELRASPRVAFSPASVLVTAKLVGAEGLEDFYCPELEWVWGDGSRSVRQGDCPPFEPGTTFEQLWSARHSYRQAGDFTVRVRLRRAGRALATASLPLVIQGRAGQAAGS